MNKTNFFKILLASFFVLLFHREIVAQKEDHQWLFNDTRVDDLTDWPFLGASVLDFNSLPPTFYRDESITLDFLETNASLCDSDGNLYLYSNGQAIHGGSHQPIVNGDTINYSPKWDWLTWENENGEVKPHGFRFVQLVGFFLVPNSDSTFLCLYHNYENQELGKFELWLSTIVKNDMGEFEVIEKDVVINPDIGVPGNIHSCLHANGRDQWILQFEGNVVYTYLINEQGLKLDHLQELPFNLRETNGQSKFNLEGNKFALYGRFQPESAFGADLMIADFDRCTGDLINPQYRRLSSFGVGANSNGLEFSPDGNLFYISRPTEIIQYDLEETSVFDSGIVISSYEPDSCSLGNTIPKWYGQLQLGPDHKIYVAQSLQCFEVNRIEYPNIRGSACTLTENAIVLPTFHYGTIPNFNTPRLGPLDGSSCDTFNLDNNPISRFWYEQDSTDHQQVQFWDVSYYRPEAWSWTFGDGNFSDENSPNHIYDTNGVYEVCLTVSNENSSNTSCQELQIGPVANNDVTIAYNISLFPNPVEDYTRLVFHDYLPEHAQLILYGSNGAKVFSSRVYQESLIDISSLKAGVYFYEIIDGQVLLDTGKIVKM